MTKKEVIRFITDWVKQRENQILLLTERLEEEKELYTKASHAHTIAISKDEFITICEKHLYDTLCKIKNTEDEIVEKTLHSKMREILLKNQNDNEEFAKALIKNERQGLEIILDRMNHFIEIYHVNKTIRSKKTFNPRKPDHYERHIKNIDLYLETLRTFRLDKEHGEEFSHWTEQALFAWEFRDCLVAEINKINTGQESRRVFLRTDNFSTENIDVPAPTDIVRDALTDILKRLKESNVEIHSKNLEKEIRQFFNNYQ